MQTARQNYRGSMRELEHMSDPVSGRQQDDDYKLPRPLEKGDIVFVNMLNKEGIVLSKPEGNTVMVQAGLIKTSVPISEIRLGERKKEDNSAKKRGSVGTRGVTSKANRDVKTELDLRGQDAEQAIMELNAFIDSAVLSGVQTIRIIHGKGTGVLRDAVGRRLKQHRSIASYRLGRYGEGENGVTIAELK